MKNKKNIIETYLRKVIKRIIKEERENQEVIQVSVKDGKYTDTWYILKTDATHVKIANNKNVYNDGMTYHINHLKSQPFYADVKVWLKGGHSPDGKEY